MGFLDHSTNNIIVDAVLTDLGRQALAKNDGSFNIYQFALGDDEVDYNVIKHFGRTVGKEKIEKNKTINEKISILTEKISNLNFDSIEIDKNYKKIISTLSIAKNQKENIEQDIQNLVEVEQKILDYDLYLMSLSKDGIPYELIAKAIPAIEKEVNNVLENMNAGFHLELEMKEKMIDAFICYGETKWNLELSSGMERFVSSLAIRIGLINVSTLPRPNFIIVDEGFGALDSDNIANMEGAFNYLKTQFDFVMIITHLDTIKDYMDVLIPIEVRKETSKVIYS